MLPFLSQTPAILAGFTVAIFTTVLKGRPVASIVFLTAVFIVSVLPARLPDLILQTPFLTMTLCPPETVFPVGYGPGSRNHEYSRLAAGGSIEGDSHIINKYIFPGLYEGFHKPRNNLPVPLCVEATHTKAADVNLTPQVLGEQPA